MQKLHFKPAVPSEGCDINKVKDFFNQEKSSGYLMFSVHNAAKHAAAAAMGKSEASV